MDQPCTLVFGLEEIFLLISVILETIVLSFCCFTCRALSLTPDRHNYDFYHSCWTITKISSISPAESSALNLFQHTSPSLFHSNTPAERWPEGRCPHRWMICSRITAQPSSALHTDNSTNLALISQQPHLHFLHIVYYNLHYSPTSNDDDFLLEHEAEEYLGHYFQ